MRALALAITLSMSAVAAPLAWHPASTERLDSRIAPPPGFERVPAAEHSFGAWLRGLPLKPADAGVHLHDGQLKANQRVHFAVVDIDVGPKDLQQCADAVMRLRGEWQFAEGQSMQVTFADTGRGTPMAFSRWAAGDRPKPKGTKLVWSRAAKPDDSYASFRRYLDTVFIWAGSSSLERQLKPVKAEALTSGDVIIKGGFPGHAVLIVDIVRNSTSRETRLLLAQSFMPAQEIHVLKNVEGPWFSPPIDSEPYDTPEWTFPAGSTRTW